MNDGLTQNLGRTFEYSIVYTPYFIAVQCRSRTSHAAVLRIAASEHAPMPLVRGR